jgi:SAM-dependent methyltransferase
LVAGGIGRVPAEPVNEVMDRPHQERPKIPAGVEGKEGGGEPWQLRMFSKSLKKKQKLALLSRQLGPTEGQTCLLVTNGDNNGALNHHLRSRGGRWTWVENESDHLAEMEALLGEPVLRGTATWIPVADASFDVVVSVDVHEHLEDCAAFNRELSRVTRSSGTVIVTTPNGDPWRPLTVLKQFVGMTPETYGHRVLGYNVRQHCEMLRQVGLTPISSASYGRFFTELLELVINFAYVKVLSKKRGARVKRGTIAPSTHDQLRAVEKQYRIYAMVYPFLFTISSLDVLLSFLDGYAVSVVARKPA